MHCERPRAPSYLQIRMDILLCLSRYFKRTIPSLLGVMRLRKWELDWTDRDFN